MNYKISRFDKNKHNRKGFDCGEPTLNKYLLEKASQDIHNDYIKLYVATEESENAVLGYYTLSSSSLPLQDIPEPLRKKLPKYHSVPAVLLGRLAVDKKVQGKGLGSELMGDAIIRSINSSIAWTVMVVDAKDDNAVKFYKHFLFTPLMDDPKHLYVRKTDLSSLVFQELENDLEDDEHIKAASLSFLEQLKNNDI